MLDRAGFKAVAHDDLFPQKTEDVVWIPKVVKLGMIILTADKSIGRNAVEVDALMTAGGRAYLSKGQMRPDVLGKLIIRSRVQL